MKTAVEWLIDKHFGGIENCTPDFTKHIEKAIEMEKEQIINAVEWGNRKGYEQHTLTCIYDEDLKYYNETYKK